MSEEEMRAHAAATVRDAINRGLSWIADQGGEAWEPEEIEEDENAKDKFWDMVYEAKVQVYWDV